MAQVPHLNALYERYRERGLVVLGVTNEPKDKVAATVKKKDMRFPIALVEGGATDRAWGVRGFPSAFLVDKTGRVVWAGNPGTFEDARLENLLGGAAAVTLLPRRYETINRLLQKTSYGAALAEIEKALKRAPGDRDLLRARREIRGVLDAALDEKKKAASLGDWSRVIQALKVVELQFTGMDEAGAATREREELMTKPEVKDELSAAKLLADAEKKLERGETAAGRDAARAVIDAHPQSYSARRARELLAKTP